MANFFEDNEDILFHFQNIDIDEIIKIRDDNFNEKDIYPYAPENIEDAKDNYKRILSIAGEIAGEYIAPRAPEIDSEGSKLENDKVTYAKGIQDSLEMIKKADLLGITVPRKYGGLNFPRIIGAMFTEMISRADASLMNIVCLQDIAETVYKFASDELKEKYLPKFCSGEITSAMALTEPDAGSDLQSVQLKAVEDSENGCWRLNGVKRFITNGCGDILLVLARSEEGTKDARGLSLFLYEKDDTLKVRRIENKLGIKASPTCELQFNNSPAYLIGKRKFGLIKYVMSMMNGARVGIALQALGIAEAAYREALKYANEREQFGKKIIEFPAVYDMVINMKKEIETTRSLVYRTAWVVDMAECLEKKLESLSENNDEKKLLRERIKKLEKLANTLTPMSKYYASEMCNKVAYDAIQVHGGTGYMKEFNVERHFRDARVTTIYEGTSQLQVVAAIGGILAGVLNEELDKFSSQKYDGDLKLLSNKMSEIYKKFLNSVNYLKEKKDLEYIEFYSRKMVDIAVDVYRGYLVLNDAKISEKKKVLAEKFIQDISPIVAMNEKYITSGNETTLKNKEKLLKEF